MICPHSMVLDGLETLIVIKPWLPNPRVPQMRNLANSREYLVDLEKEVPSNQTDLWKAKTKTGMGAAG